MKVFLMLFVLVLSGFAFAQEKYSLTIYVTDSKTEDRPVVIKAFYIKEWKPGMVKLEKNNSGVYQLELEEGSYAFEFTNAAGAVINFKVDLKADTIKTVTFNE